MPKCKWCGESFSRNNLTSSGYCDDCNTKIRNDIVSNKKKLSDLGIRAINPDISSDETSEILSQTEAAYSVLRKYKMKGVTFFKSDIDQPRNYIYQALHITPPPTDPVTSHRTNKGAVVSVIIGVCICLGLLISLFRPDTAEPVDDTSSFGFAYDWDDYDNDWDLESVSSSLTQPLVETKEFHKELVSGHYWVGIDIPAGTYDFTAIKGGGNVISSGGQINAIMGVPSKNENGLDMYEEKYKNIPLAAGDVLSILGVKLGVKAPDAHVSEMVKRDQEISEEVSLSNGIFVSGTDFDPGTYNIAVTSGGGNVISSDGDAFGINAIMGTSDKNTNGIDMYEQEFRNVLLPDRTILDIRGVDIKLTPST